MEHLRRWVVVSFASSWRWRLEVPAWEGSELGPRRTGAGEDGQADRSEKGDGMKRQLGRHARHKSPALRAPELVLAAVLKLDLESGDRFLATT